MLGVNDGGSKTDYVQCLKARKKKKVFGNFDGRTRDGNNSSML